MSVYYLIDAHTVPLTSSEINDVIDSRTDILSSGNPAVVANGNFVIRIGDDQRLAADPTSLSDLLTQKYEGLKQRYGFNNILYDSFLDSTGVASSGVGKVGSRSIMNPRDTLTTVAQNATGTVSTALVIVEYFRWRYINPKDGRLLRVYEEIPPTGSISLSTNNGVDFTFGITSGSTVNIPTGEEGSQVVLSFSTNASDCVGSWAVLY